MRAIRFALLASLCCATFAAEPAAKDVVVRPAAPALGAGAIDIAAAAHRIDDLVDAALAAQNVKPNAAVADDVFVRRIYLDAIGRIPTPAEYVGFTSDHSSARRATLIHHLLAGEGYVSRQYDWWADLLRLQSRMTKKYPGDTYIDWMKTAIRADQPYDRMVYDLLTANGPMMERGNGKAGYYVRDAKMPQDNMANTVQAFLGTRIQCAQCHNHPFDKWTRLDYLRMSAFTGGVKEGPEPELAKELRKYAMDDGKISQEEKQSIKKFLDRLDICVSATKKDTVPVPKDYQYADAKSGDTVRAKSLFGADAPTKRDEDPRPAYAAWVSSPDNPRFTLVIANRMWKQVMGLGLIEPVDNLTETTAPTEPALMDGLTKLMKDVKYDLRQFEEVLLNTKAYQRVANIWEGDPAEYRFSGPLLRRMTAEQAWDSLLTLVVPDLDQRKLANPDIYYTYFEQLKGKTAAELMTLATEFAQKVKRRQALGQRLKDMQAAGKTRAEMAQDPELQRLRKEQQDLDGQIKTMGYDGNAPVKEDDRRWDGIRRDLVRASELPSPAPPGHFLRDFGQSDRELIDNANNLASVPQALNLLNGFVDQELMKPQATLMRLLAAETLPEGKAKVEFIAILGRQPSGKELAALHALKGPMDKAVTDLIWALVNSHEFLFVQ